MENLDEQIKIFVEAIVNKSNSSKSMKSALINYRNFLLNTKLIKKQSEIDSWLNVIISCTELIIGFKESFGSVDLDAFLESVNIYTAKQNDVKLDPKHYGHYHNDTSSSCGIGSTSSACGTSNEDTYSSSCGGSTLRFTSRC